MTAGGGIATGTMSGLQTAGIPACRKKKTHERKVYDYEGSGPSLTTKPPTAEIAQIVAIKSTFLELVLCPSYTSEAVSNMAIGTAQN